MDHAVTLYHFWPSLCSQKVRLALVEKGVDYRSMLVNIGPPMENYAPSYARINPRMVVPTLVVDEDIITDSATIVVQIDRRFDGPDLGADRLEVQRFIALQDELEIREIILSRRGVLSALLKRSIDKRIAVLTTQRDTNPDLAALYNARIDDIRQTRQRAASPPEVHARRLRVLEALDHVEHALGTTDFLCDTYSLADVVWTVMLARLKFIGFEDRWGEATRDYYTRMKARPSFDHAQVWERVKPMVILPIIAQAVAKRIGLSR